MNTHNRLSPPSPKFIDFRKQSNFVSWPSFDRESGKCTACQTSAISLFENRAHASGTVAIGAAAAASYGRCEEIRCPANIQVNWVRGKITFPIYLSMIRTWQCHWDGYHKVEKNLLLDGYRSLEPRLNRAFRHFPADWHATQKHTPCAMLLGDGARLDLCQSRQTLKSYRYIYIVLYPRDWKDTMLCMYADMSLS